MMRSAHVKQHYLGKKLIYLLRYGAEKEGLIVDREGYVDLEELVKLHMMRDFTKDDVVKEIDTSISFRGIKRMELRHCEDAKILIRATYGRRMERNPFHAGTKVLRLLDLTISAVEKNIDLYDFEHFPDDYLLNLIMRRMKRSNTLTNKSLKTFLVPALVHLDLWNVYVNEKTLILVSRYCENLKSLTLRDCGYLVTDHILYKMLQRLHVLESLNLFGCHHVTDKTLPILAKHCPHLRHLNLTKVAAHSFRPTALLEFVASSIHLEELIMPDYDGFSDAQMDGIFTSTSDRKFYLETAKTVKLLRSEDMTSIYDSTWERPNYR